MIYGNTNKWQISLINLTFALLLLTAAVIIPPANAKKEKNDVYRIGFHLWKPGKIYDEAIAGIKDGLLVNGIKFEAVQIESNRDKTLAEQNLKKLDNMDLDLIYSLSSAGTKLAKRIGMQTPIIATVINHPVSLGVDDDDKSTNIQLTGTSYYVDAKKQLRFYQSIFPKINKVGMIFDSHNPAGYLAEEPFMRKACNDLGIAFFSMKIRDKNELESVTEKLIRAGVEIIVIPTNRLVYSNLDAVLNITNKHKVPVVSMNKQGIENGALAALYADTYNLGRQAADMTKQIFVEDVPPGKVKFQFIPEPDIILNLKSAKQLGVEFPPDILSKATIVMQ